MEFRVALLILTLAPVAACGPGQGTAGDALAERPSDDAGPMQQDANYAACSYASWDVEDPVPTHTAVLDYDKPLHNLDANYDPDFTVAAFTDDGGIAVFASQHFIRATLDGDFVSSSAYGTNPSDGQPIELEPSIRPAQAPGMYAAPFFLFGDWFRFCLVQEDGTLDLSTCPPIARGAGLWEPAWDGTSFRLVTTVRSPTETARFITTYDVQTGQETAVARLAGSYGQGSTRSFFYSDRVELFTSGEREGTPCNSDFFESLSPAFDEASRKSWDLLPSDFHTVTGLWDAASSGRRTLIHFDGQCWLQPPWAKDPYIPCSEQYPYNPPRRDFLAFVDGTGTPTQPYLQVNGGVHELSWDGLHFVDFRWDDVMLYTEDGAFAARAGIPSGLPAGPSQAYSGIRLVPVGPWDYLFFYSDIWTGVTHMARFHLVPL